MRSTIFSFLIFLFSTNSISVTAQEATKKPLNVVWISCEDVGPIMGAYGVDQIKTPNIDKLAAEGVRYSNAYSTVGVCAPSRFSIITSMYPARLGAHNMRTGDLNNYKTPENLALKTTTNKVDKAGRPIPEYEVVTPENVKPFTQYLRAEGYYCINDNKCDYQFNAPFTAWDHTLGSNLFDKIPDNQPFFYVKNSYTTHESRIWLRKDKPLTVLPDEVIVPDYYPDIPEVRNDLAIKYSNIEALDKEVGQLLKDLEAKNLLENTIIFFWSDHGGNLLRQKRAVGNSGLHVPLIIRYPNKYKAGDVEDALVSLMDLGPTVMSLLDIKPPKHTDGQAFAGRYKKEPRDYIFGSADRFDESIDMQRSVLDGRFVYIKNFITELPLIFRNKYREKVPMNKKLIDMDINGELSGAAAYIFMKTKPVEELYDLQTDPDEVHNLALNPTYESKLMELRTALSKWQVDIDDQGFKLESEIIKEFWPEMIQPITSDVIIEINSDGLVKMSCDTNGASIGYQTEALIGEDRWLLYTEPIKITSTQKLMARAIRIGYKASNITSN
jgi:N-sulfoglucosamine sulfohydrolase